MRLRLFSVLTIFLTPFAFMARAQPLADKVPGDALIYVGWQGAGTAAPGFEGSHLQAILKGSDVPQFFNEFLPGLPTSDGQFAGQGCVYPAGVQNIATQLEGAGFTWRGYMQDMANSAPAQPATCRHPAIGAHDSTQTASATDQYAARHNPLSTTFHRRRAAASKRPSSATAP
jgi:hypothetical protein